LWATFGPGAANVDVCERATAVDNFDDDVDFYLFCTSFITMAVAKTKSLLSAGLVGAVETVRFPVLALWTRF